MLWERSRLDNQWRFELRSGALFRLHIINKCWTDIEFLSHLSLQPTHSIVFSWPKSWINENAKQICRQVSKWISKLASHRRKTMALSIIFDDYNMHFRLQFKLIAPWKNAWEAYPLRILGVSSEPGSGNFSIYVELLVCDVHKNKV